MKKSIWLRLLVTATLFSGLTPAYAQDSLADSYTDISRIALVKSMGKLVSSSYIKGNEDINDKYSALSFKPGIIYSAAIPNHLVPSKWLLKFKLCNSADSAVNVYFFP